jgi:hypothetical protein
MKKSVSIQELKELLLNLMWDAPASASTPLSSSSSSSDAVDTQTPSKRSPSLSGASLPASSSVPSLSPSVNVNAEAVAVRSRSRSPARDQSARLNKPQFVFHQRSASSILVQVRTFVNNNRIDGTSSASNSKNGGELSPFLNFEQLRPYLEIALRKIGANEANTDLPFQITTFADFAQRTRQERNFLSELLSSQSNSSSLASIANASEVSASATSDNTFPFHCSSVAEFITSDFFRTFLQQPASASYLADFAKHRSLTIPSDLSSVSVFAPTHLSPLSPCLWRILNGASPASPSPSSSSSSSSSPLGMSPTSEMPASPPDLMASSSVESVGAKRRHVL